MTLETITGNLKNAYPRIVPGTMLRVDQLTNERRLNPITETGEDLRRQSFYTADGNLYTLRNGEVIWGITREPQNLVLQNIEEAFYPLTEYGNYLPDALEAQASFEHPDTVRIAAKGLQLGRLQLGGYKEHGCFAINPKKVKELNSEQKLAATRIFGPDEDNFERNMELFAQAGKTPVIYALMPDYVKYILENNAVKCLAQASWLDDSDDVSVFYAFNRYIDVRNRVRGIAKPY